MLDNGLIRLDFAEYGHIDLPPTVAQALISDERVHSRIRREILRARGQLKLGAQAPETINEARGL